MATSLTPLREWLSRHATPEMRDNQVFVTIDAAEEEIDELKTLIRHNKEVDAEGKPIVFSLKFLDAVERVGIPVCMEDRLVILDDKCAKCGKVAPKELA